MTTSEAVLLFADPDDYNASAVQWILAKNGIPSLIAKSLANVDPYGVSISFDDEQIFKTNFGSYRNQIKSAWYRRAQDPAPLANCDPRDVKFVAAEWKDLQRGLFFEASNFLRSFWVNLPLAAIRAENKLLQLKIAKEIGLSVPITLVSNDAAEIRRFINKNSPVIVKTFDAHLWDTSENQSIFGTTVAVLDDATELSDESLNACPAIYQQLVKKTCDIRVTIIGDKLFPAKLMCSKGGALLDWRPSTFTSDLVYQAIELPTALEQKLLLLQQKLGLVFGCVDLALDRDGNYFFFEVNQSGQFLFVEELFPSLPLLRAFSAMLAQGRPDYSMSSMADLGYADYKASNEYLALAARRRAETQALLAALDLKQETSEGV